MAEYPVPVDHIKERTLIARVQSNMWHANPGMVLVAVNDVYTYDRHKKASVEALPIASHLSAPDAFYHFGVNGSWDDNVANVSAHALRDVAIVENGVVVEWFGKVRL